jgi:hypothetical protein
VYYDKGKNGHPLQRQDTGGARRPLGGPLQPPPSGSPGAGEQGLLNRLTISHVVLGFLAFRQAFLRTHQPEVRWRILSRDEVALLEKWQEYHDAGWLSAETFADRVETLVGDLAPSRAFMGFDRLGSIVPRMPPDVFTPQLHLSVIQAQETRAAYVGLHEAIRVARLQTHVHLRAVLKRDDASVIAILERDRCRGRRVEQVPLAERLIESLGLAGAQQAQLAMDCALLRYQVQHLHHIARSRFMSLLTASQRSILESSEQTSSPDPESPAD